MKSVIEIKDLKKYYGKKRGAENISFSVNEGEIFGFLGSNGAGKSTTIRCALGLIRPSGGSVDVLGMPMPEKRREILSRTGYLPSEAMFYPTMTVAETIRFAADIRKKDCSDRAKKLCDTLGLDRTKKIGELSLGNRKKVSIVCALQHDPELLILDEPTSGLDPLIQEIFFELLHRRCANGASCLFSSHILPEVRKHCDRAAIIRDGSSILRVDTVENLTKSSSKAVRVEGIDALPKLEGIHDEKKTPEGFRFGYNGEISALISALAPLEVSDLLITEPELEEAFMKYYRG